MRMQPREKSSPGSVLQHGVAEGSFAWPCAALQTPAALWQHVALPDSAYAAGSPSSAPVPPQTS